MKLTTEQTILADNPKHNHKLIYRTWPGEYQPANIFNIFEESQEIVKGNSVEHTLEYYDTERNC